MASGWTVVSQRAGEQYMPNGTWQDVVEVQILTDGGTYKTFKVPEATYTAENVKAIIDAWVEREKAVGNL